VRYRGTATLLAVAHLDALQIERGEHQLHPAAGQGGVDPVGVDVQGNGRGLSVRVDSRRGSGTSASNPPAR
jgi:hypothetical protein